METDPILLDKRLERIDWSTWPAGVKRDRVAVPSGALARITMGPPQGERVILVPGATGSKEDFRRLVPLLADAGLRVEAFDLAGQFESADAGPEHLDPPRDRYELDLFVDDLIAVIESGKAPAHVLGYSFAGTVAAATAIRRPDLVSTVTLLGAPPIPGKALRGMVWVGWLARFASSRVAAATLIQGIRWNVEGGPRDRHPFLRARMRRTRLSSVRDIMALMADTPDLAGQLRATGIPVLVAVGAHDLWPTRLHRDFATRIGATLSVYRAGHGPCETAPHQLTADLVRLFARAR